MKLIQKVKASDILSARAKTAATKMEIKKDVSWELLSLQVTAIF